jgi:hypothetical protein
MILLESLFHDIVISIGSLVPENGSPFDVSMYAINLEFSAKILLIKITTALNASPVC